MDDDQLFNKAFEYLEKEFIERSAPFIIKIVNKRKRKQKLSRLEQETEELMRENMRLIKLDSITINYNDGVSDRTIVYSVVE